MSRDTCGLVWEKVAGRETPLVQLTLTLDEAEDLAYMYGPDDGAFDEIMAAVTKGRDALAARQDST